ncbi:MAG TPA: ethanolamine ammonia lyase-activating protein [Candidatus Binatia bacterium]|jgi:oxalate decarboxylase/phosphoglucose isomerase-like protein (cupin superfamily)/mannose-6-phosphate isomerase-like protein (cupin superfamily)
MESTTQPRKQNPRPKSAYDLWQEEQGVPAYRGHHIEDLYSVKLGPWPWFHGNGAILNLGEQVNDDAWVIEIPAGKSLAPVRHLFEIQFFVLSGRGSAEVWQPGKAPRVFEWGSGSMFSTPLNSHYRLHNGDGEEPARLFAVTTAPTMINLLRDRDFIFNNRHVFADRFDNEENYFTGPGTYMGPKTWKTNFVADVRSFKLEEKSARGHHSTYIRFSISSNVMAAHIAEFEIGTYKKAHRHEAGAHVVVVSGEGYSLMWPPGSKPMRFNWRDGSVISPPEGWFHQHMNIGSAPARYLALRWNSPEFPRLSHWMADRGETGGYEQIEYQNEDPAIREEFEAELARRGIEARLPETKRRAAG